MDWCDILRAAIRDSGRTTYRLAQESGVDVQTIDRIMTGREPRLGTAERLAAVLGLRLVTGKRLTRTGKRE